MSEIMKLLVLIFAIVFDGLLASPATPSYASYHNYGSNVRYPPLNRTATRSRKIDPVRQQQEQKSCTDKFCTDFADYPKDYIQSLNLEKFEHLFVDDFIDTLALRFDADESGLCQSRQRLIHPRRGVTADGTWLTIVNNDEKLRQGILIEECIDQNYPCDYAQNFPLSVESKCKQSYMYRSLLAIDPQKGPVTEHFQFPSCCKCVVTIGHRSNTNRFGGDVAGETRADTDPPYIFSN